MTTVARAIADARARPVHVVTAACVAGLAAGPRAPQLLVAAIVVVPLVCPGPLAALAALAALAGGAGLAHARLAALEHSSLTPRIGHAVRARVVVLETPRAIRGGWRATSSLAGARVLLRGGGGTPHLATGDLAAITGGLRPPGPRDDWLRTRHVGAILRVRTLRRVGVRGGLSAPVDAIRRRAQRSLSAGIPAQQAALLRGMVLGDDGTMAIADRDELRRAGLGHLVAASGANVALLASLALGAGALLGLGRRARLLAVLCLTCLYVPLAGSGASIERAGIMGAAAVVATLASRPAARWHALLLAAAVTLGLDPDALADPGWELSFAAVVAIAILAHPIAAALERRGVPRVAAEATAVTAAATLGAAPAGAAVFGTVSLVALPANLLAAPAVAPATWLGMLAAAAGQVALPLARPLTALAAYPAAYVQAIGHLAASMPSAQVAARPVPVAVACLALAGALGGGRRLRRLALAGGTALLAGALLWPVPAGRRGATAEPLPGRTRATFLDVGQGDATLLQAAGRAILVDSGPPGDRIVGMLHRAGITRLDVLVVTHAQADHDGGAAQVLRRFSVGLVLDGRDGVREPQGTQLAAAAVRRGVRMAVPLAGDVVRAGSLALRVLSPQRRDGPPVAGADPNARAVVAVGSGPGLRVLLTADAESDVLTHLDPGPVDVLKVSHHGSADPGLPALLARLRPRLAVIEVGAPNPYGHPAPATLAALRAAQVPLRRTDRDGSVRVDAGPGWLRVQDHA